MNRLGQISDDRGACDIVWEALADEERIVYQQAGYHRRFGVGASPALVIVDVEYNFTDTLSRPITDSVKIYSNSCGPAAWQTIPEISELLDYARQAGVPVVFTHGIPGDEPEGRPRRGTDIIDEIRPGPGEWVLSKPAASAFYRTNLAEDLCSAGVDTLLYAGCVTSGCVRASVVDGAAHGFKNAVVENCVFDRAVLPHQLSLFDMDAKYADVMSLDASKEYLADQ